jgi:predicted amidohydrolase
VQGDFNEVIMFKVGYFQFNPRFGDLDANRDTVQKALEPVEADLVVLPELPFTGYSFKNRRELASMAEDPARSETFDLLAGICRRKRMYIVTGFAEKDGSRMFNASLLIGPRGLIHTYRKIHLFNEEKRYFDPGDLRLGINTVRSVRVGMMICFDWVFPEVARTLTLEGTELLCHPSNLVLDYCQKSMLTRCLENGIFAVTTNRFGLEKRPHGSVRFTGGSQVVGPRGQLLARAAAQRKQLTVVEIDPKESKNKSLTERNHLLRDRRPEFYL